MSANRGVRACAAGPTRICLGRRPTRTDPGREVAVVDENHGDRRRSADRRLGRRSGALYGLSAVRETRSNREDILEGVPQAGPMRGRPMNFLVLGSDSRGKRTQTRTRRDRLPLRHDHDRAHSKARSGAFIVSIPRDSYVDVPAGGDWPGGKNKINAALAFGGANLAAKTVYNLTQVPLNGAMIVNFNGVHKMVAAVGGVNVCTPFTVGPRSPTRSGSSRLSRHDARRDARSSCASASTCRAGILDASRTSRTSSRA